MFIININAAKIKVAMIFEVVPVSLQTFPVVLQMFLDYYLMPINSKKHFQHFICPSGKLQSGRLILQSDSDY